ncbi:MAG: glycosyltransferase family 4 protein [Vampirovibrionales bacterium]|nr:glycosyltransferase family 4 protein [Vampirovibrionales bacterium]
MELEKGAVSEPPIRVLYLCHDGGLYGAEQSLLQLITHLDHTQVKPFVSIARPGPLAKVMEAIPGVTVLSHHRVSWVKHAQRHWFQRIGDVIALGINALRRVPPLVQTIKTNTIQVVHTNSVVSLEGALAVAYCRLTGYSVAHVWHIRELFTYPNPRFQAVLGAWLMRYGIPLLSQRIIAISQAVIDQFPKRYAWSTSKKATNRSAISDPNTVMVLPNPVLLHISSTKKTSLPHATMPHTVRLGFVGRLSPGKGLLTVIQALGLLKNNCSHSVELHLYGKFVDTRAEAEILQTIQQCQVASQVVFHGFTDPCAIYDTIEALILPSNNEAFGRVLVEAMANGVLCLGANAGAIPELLKPNKTGWLFKADNPADCTTQIALLLEQWRESPQAIEGIRTQAKQHAVTVCNPTRHAENVTRIYQRIVAEEAKAN